jgi:predicted ribosome quality control (RQC) complex YloA/Tae2 family protein
MHLSEISIVADDLNLKSRGGVISNVYRSTGGTLIKLFGSDLKGIYFNTKEKVIFPVSDISKYVREPLSKVEEGLRSNLTGKIKEVSVLEKLGKVVSIKTGSKELIVPLFGGKSVFIKDFQGNVLWQENNDTDLNVLQNEMKYFQPAAQSGEEFELLFFKAMKEKEEGWKTAFLEKKIDSLNKLKSKLEAELKEHKKKSIEFFKTAEIIKANLYQIENGKRMKSLNLPDYSGSCIDILLDPSKTVIENLDVFFHKAAKHKKGIAHVSKRLELLYDELMSVEKGDIEIPPDYGDPNSGIKKKKSRHVPYHKYCSSTGRIYLVGKGAKDNDELTFKVASVHDMWFHAKDMSGSHVIMHCGKNEKVRKEDIKNGGILALYYSKAKQELKGEVWVTFRKNIVKKKGMAPGKVVVRKGEVKYFSAQKFPENLKKTEQF